MIGKNVSHYRITEKLGEGGMGEVYRATDTKLGREVAAKLLPPELSADSGARARFQQEAKAASALDHPNISTIHEIGEEDGRLFIIMALYDGETLREKLSREGKLSVTESCRIAAGVAAGLAKVHERGITHRDIKPANIMVTNDRAVKILDFGVAKLVQPEGQDLTAMTWGGALVGTVPYMAPEQARGETVGPQTDLWALGVLLYEMLTGVSPFARGSVPETLHAIGYDEPEPIERLRPEVPNEIAWLVERLLVRDARQRRQSAADLAQDLERWASGRARRVELEPGEEPQASDPERPPGLKRSWAIAAGAAALAALVTSLAIGRGGNLATDSDETSITSVARLTHEDGFSDWPSWSPDGNVIAFASNRSGNFEIYVRRVDGGQEVNITEDGGEDYQPAFSPDGNRIAFVSTRSSRTPLQRAAQEGIVDFRAFGGDIWLAPALGGRASLFAKDANSPTWHPRGEKLAYYSGPEGHRSIVEMPAQGGEPRVLLDSASSDYEIVRLRYSPDGRWLSFEARGQLFFLSTEPSPETPRSVLRGLGHVWHPSGNLLYLTREPAGGTGIRSVDVGSDGTLRGSPRTLSITTGMLRELAISPDGTRLAAAEFQWALHTTLLPLTPEGDAPAGPERVLTRGAVMDRAPAVSQNSTRIAYASNRLGRADVWVVDIESGEQERIEMPEGTVQVDVAFWTPDGRLGVQKVLESGTTTVSLIALDGSGDEDILTFASSTRSAGAGPLPRDGKRLIYTERVDDTRQVFALDMDTGDSTQLTTDPADKSSARWSPSGDVIAFAAAPPGLQDRVFTMPAAGGEPVAMTSGERRMRHFFFSPDGRWLYVQPDHQNIYRLPASGGELTKVTDFAESDLFIDWPTISPDGRFLAYVRASGGASLWLLTLGAESPPEP